MTSSLWIPWKPTCVPSTVLRNPDFSWRFLMLPQTTLEQSWPEETMEKNIQSYITARSHVAQCILLLRRKPWPLSGHWKNSNIICVDKFDLETDHQALTWINSMKNYNSCLLQWWFSLQAFRFIIGKCNIVADYLSRLVKCGNLER